jgi:hypothetical protein
MRLSRSYEDEEGCERSEPLKAYIMVISLGSKEVLTLNYKSEYEENRGCSKSLREV